MYSDLSLGIEIVIKMKSEISYIYLYNYHCLIVYLQTGQLGLCLSQSFKHYL